MVLVYCCDLPGSPNGTTELGCAADPLPDPLFVTALNFLEVSAHVRVALDDAFHACPEARAGAHGMLVLQDEIAELW